MKKYIISIFALMLLCLGAAAQGKIFTKKARVADFTAKTTKVVLTGDRMLDRTLQNEISSHWYISPYEFCTVRDFENLKDDSAYYFLRLVTRDSDPGIVFLSILKGGTTSTWQTTERQYEVVRFPFAAESMGSGREYLFLPAMLSILQKYMEDAMRADTFGYSGFSHYNLKIRKTDPKKVVLSADDLSMKVVETLDSLFTGRLVMAPDTEGDSEFVRSSADAIVSLVISPMEYEGKAYSYVMLIDALTHELYYYRRHRVRSEETDGFTPEDIKLISKAIAHEDRKNEKRR